MNSLGVSGLPESVTEENLKALFTPFGRVMSAHILRDLEGRSLGCGGVEMSCKEEVYEILSTKDRISVGGKRPNIWLGQNIPQQAAKKLEVLIRWACSCAVKKFCPSCNGKGYQEQWLPIDLKDMAGVHFIIRGRRYVSSPLEPKESETIIRT